MANIINQNGENSNIERERELGEINFGQYYRYTPAEGTESRNFRDGEIYPVIRMGIHHISKNVHNVTLFVPRHLSSYSDGQSITLHISELEKNFTFVPQEQAEDERKKLLEKFEAMAIGIQRDLQESLSSPQSVMQKIMHERNEKVVESRSKIDFSIPTLPSAAAMAADSRAIVPTSKGQSVETLRRQLQNQQQLGEVVTVYAKEKNDELQNILQNTASIMQEKGKAISGQAKSMIQMVGDVESKLEQLSLYMGEGVRVMCVIDAPESTSKEKIQLFSQMLFCDEEMLTHSVFSNGKFDYLNLTQFFEHLVDDREFCNRILPTERCVVVLRSRRNEKRYVDNPIDNRLINMPNFSTFMLVKDGERVSAIFSDIDYQPRMFPTQAEMDSYMSNIEGVEDVRLTDAQRNLKLRHDMYSKVAAILQGIADRQETGGEIVFGELPLHIHSSSFFDPKVLEANVDFINDEDFLIGQHKILTDPRSWVNKHIICEHKVGDYIYFNEGMFNYENVPSAFYEDVHLRWEPQARWEENEKTAESIKLVTFSRNKVGIRVNAINTSLGKKNYGNTKDMFVELKKNTRTLNLKELRLSELNLMIASRIARPYISSDMTMLLKAREDIQLIMNNSESIRAVLNDKFEHLSHEDLYLYLLKWSALKKVDLTQPVKITKSVMRQVSDIIEKDTLITEDLKATLAKFANEQNEVPLVIAKNITDTYLITDCTQKIVQETPIWQSEDMKGECFKLLAAKAYRVVNDGLVEYGYADNSLISKLTYEHFFVKEQNFTTYTKRIGSKFVDAVSFLNSQENRDAKEKFEQISLMAAEAIFGSDEKKKHVCQKLMSICNEEPYESIIEKSERVITPRVCFASTVCFSQDNSGYHLADALIPKFNLGFASLNLIYAIIKLANSIEDTITRKKLIFEVKGFLNQEMLYKKDFIENNFDQWSGYSLIQVSKFGEVEFNTYYSDFHRNEKTGGTIQLAQELGMGDLAMPIYMSENPYEKIN